MNTATKLAAYTGGLAAIFAAALGVGAAVGSPIDMPTATHGDTHLETPNAAPETPGGLQVSEQGYTLSEITTGPDALSFRITGPTGEPVTAFTEEHEKKLHLIVVRSDTTGYRHVHPTMSDDGTWTVDWAWQSGGSYRVFADFRPTDGPALTLGRTVDVAGDTAPAPTLALDRIAEVDGYRVELTGELDTGGGPLTLNVSRDGVPVTDLQPYLGAFGHLVALRTGDLAYLHVHPQGAPGDGVTAPGPEIVFHAQAPSQGTYRLFLDFRHQNTVRTAEFTVTADQPGTPDAHPTPAPAASTGHGH
ncbi:hypothetical protein ACFWQG_00745 [Rhodococcus sp. NPDC058532]|uniref:hypothetical protein n=1 Tax=Rhodococcus sp. NPDC058532 TaxID=3346540 RepID=UPI0036474869